MPCVTLFPLFAKQRAFQFSLVFEGKILRFDWLFLSFFLNIGLIYLWDGLESNLLNVQKVGIINLSKSVHTWLLPSIVPDRPTTILSKLLHGSAEK